MWVLYGKIIDVYGEFFIYKVQKNTKHTGFSLL